MQRFVGKRVNHKAFGKGVISEITDKIVTVLFDEHGVKKLGTVFLNNGVLALDDEDASIELNTIRDTKMINQAIEEYNRLVSLIPNSIIYSDECINTIDNARNYYKRNIAILHNKVDNSIVENYHNRIEDLRRLNSSNKNNGVVLNNIIFRITYCDGGKSNNGIGFADICSKDLIASNIRSNRPNCNNKNSYCKKYNDDIISRQQLERKNKNDVCYECHLLNDLKIGAGYRNVGKQNQTPIRIGQGNENGIVFLTTKKLNAGVEDMYIFGAFLISELYRGGSEDGNIPGYVIGNQEYKVHLTEEEANNFKLFDYYHNVNGNGKPAWGAGLFRYADDVVTKNILKAMINVITDPLRKQAAKDLLDKFIELH